VRRKNLLLAFALPAVVALPALLAPATAEAYEHQWHIGGSFGYAVLLGGSTWNGFGGGAHVAYGINDSFNLMGQIDVTDHPAGNWLIVSGGVGAGYVFDVLQWVPYVGLLVGPAGLISTDPSCGISTAEPCRAIRFNVEIPLGIDYQVSRSFAVGLGGRVQLLIPGPTPAPWPLIGVVARAEYTWGY
jgi:hypothetical protein